MPEPLLAPSWLDLGLKSGSPHAYGCVMVGLDPKSARAVQSYARRVLAKADLLADGAEAWPHITVRYGLHADDAEPVRAIVRQAGPLEVRVGGLTLFQTPDYDVLKYDVVSDDLQALHAALGELEHTDTHADYRPHLTVVYLKPGAGLPYVGNGPLTGRTLRFDTAVFSDRQDRRTELPLGGPAVKAAEEWDMAETLVNIGGSVKAAGVKGNYGTVKGYLVLFGAPGAHDVAGDFFTPETDFCVDEWPVKSHAWYHHTLDPGLKAKRFPQATLGRDETGVWLQGQLDLRDSYEAAVYRLAEQGKLGLSSGTATHLVERKSAANGTHEITRWPLGLDASYTVTPAEPRTQVMALKSWLECTANEGLQPVEPAPETKGTHLGDLNGAMAQQAMMKAHGALMSCLADYAKGYGADPEGTEQRMSEAMKEHHDACLGALRGLATKSADPAEIKGMHLGPFAETTVLSAAMQSAQGYLYSQCAGLCADERLPAAERNAGVRAALDEYHALIDRLAAAMFPLTETADDEGEGAEPSLFAWSDMKSFLSPLPGRRFTEHLGTVLATVEGFIARAESVKAARAVEGRGLSETHRERIAALQERLGRLYAASETHDDALKGVWRDIEQSRLALCLTGVD